MFILFAAPISVLEYVPNFFFGSLMLFIGLEIMMVGALYHRSQSCTKPVFGCLTSCAAFQLQPKLYACLSSQTRGPTARHACLLWQCQLSRSPAYSSCLPLLWFYCMQHMLLDY